MMNVQVLVQRRHMKDEALQCWLHQHLSSTACRDHCVTICA